MKNYLLPFVAILILLSCNKRASSTAESATNSEWKLDSIAFNERIHIDNDTLKDGMALDLYLQYPQSAPADFSLEKIQQTIAQLFTGDANFNGNIHQAFDKVKETYVTGATELGQTFSEMVAEFGESIPSFSYYEQSDRMEIDNIFNRLLTMNAHTYAYTGGAHGYGSTSFYHIDLKDGTIVSDTILFGENHLGQIAKLLQEEVQRRNVDENSVEYITLLVGIDEIVTNNNFFFTKEGINYLYNQYEIAPYSQGPVEVAIPYSKILPFVSQPYLKAVEEIQLSDFPAHETYD